MTISSEVFEELLDQDYNSDLKGDWVFEGMKILDKYLPNQNLIEGADHDIIYSVDIDELIEAGITKEDVIMLGKFNWHTQDGYLAHFV